MRNCYPLVLAHPDFSIECGELNNPSFFVTFRNRVLTTQRLLKILSEARRFLKARASDDAGKLARLQTALRTTEGRLAKLYDAVETGVIDLDETLRARMQRAKAEREGIILEMAGLRRFQGASAIQVLPSQIEAFAKVMRGRLRDRRTSFARDYLRAVVDRIEIKGEEAVISGSHARLAEAIGGRKPGTDQVPSFVPEWRTRRDSNS